MLISCIYCIKCCWGGGKVKILNVLCSGQIQRDIDAQSLKQ